MKNQYIPSRQLALLASPLALLLMHGAPAKAAEIEHLDPVTVTASPDTNSPRDATHKKVAMGPLGERAVADTPYSVESVDSDVIKAQQMKSQKDIFRLFPSVQGDGARPQSRGVQGSVIQNSMLDGLNIVSTTEYPAEQFEEVQVLNGLAGSMYGPANPAGIFNFVSRRPTDEPHHSVTVGIGTGLSVLSAADLSGPIDKDKRVTYRLNVMNEEGDGYTDKSSILRRLVNVAMDFKVTDSTTVETNFDHYHYRAKGLPSTYALTDGVQLPSAMDATKSQYAEAYAGNDDQTDTASIHLKHRFSDNWSMHLGFLRQIADRESTVVTNTFTDNSGNYKATTSQSTASRFVVNSYLATLNGKVNTGTIAHDLSFGFRGFDWDNYNPRNGSTLTLGTSNINNPTDFGEPAYPEFTDRYRSAHATQASYIFGDTVTFSPKWSLMATGSNNYISTANYSKLSIATSDAADHGLSGSASLMYKPVTDLMLYTTYADSLQQGDVAPSGSSNAGSILSPYRSKQYEFGSKLALNKVLLTAAFFQIKRPYAYTQNGVYALGGQQANRGFEFMADGQVTQRVRMIGGFTWLDPRLTGTGSNSTTDKQIVGLPKMTANLFTEYRLPIPQNIAVNMNAHYIGKRATDNANNYWSSGFALFDVGANYKTAVSTYPVTFRLSVSNLFDKQYWTNIVPGALTGYTGSGYASAQLGAPRMVTGSVQVEF